MASALAQATIKSYYVNSVDFQRAYVVVALLRALGDAAVLVAAKGDGRAAGRSVFSMSLNSCHLPPSSACLVRDVRQCGDTE